MSKLDKAIIVLLLIIAIFTVNRSLYIQKLKTELEAGRHELQQLQKENKNLHSEITQVIEDKKLEKIQDLAEQNEDLRELLGMIIQDSADYMEKYGEQFEAANKAHGVKWVWPQTPEEYITGGG